MSERKKSRPWLTAVIVGCVLVAMIGGYVGAYYAMVERVAWANMHGPIEMIEPGYHDPFAKQDRKRGLFDPPDGPLPRVPRTNSWWTTFFAPIHWLDKRLRPRVWNL